MTAFGNETVEKLALKAAFSELRVVELSALTDLKIGFVVIRRSES
jgi:hypothetical protein